MMSSQTDWMKLVPAGDARGLETTTCLVAVHLVSPVPPESDHSEVHARLNHGTMALSKPGTRMGRLGLVVLAALALLAGLWVRLVRIGWPLPPVESNLVAIHGALMLAGFLGLVIGLEGAVALGRTWTFGAPSLAGLRALSLPPLLRGRVAARLPVARRRRHPLAARSREDLRWLLV